ncbi:hypothetical protein ACT17S_00395 [Glutamicibacter mysorens]
MSRFSLAPIIRGHWKGLTNDTKDGNVNADWVSRILLISAPTLLVTATLVFGWQVHSPSAILSAVALLSAGLLGVFTQLSGLRVRLTERKEEEWLDVERDGIDEAVSHILFSFLLCIFICVLLVIGINVAASEIELPAKEFLRSCWSALVFATTSYVVLTMVILVPKLYSAYTEMNEVKDELNGFHTKR